MGYNIKTINLLSGAVKNMGYNKKTYLLSGAVKNMGYNIKKLFVKWGSEKYEIQ